MLIYVKTASGQKHDLEVASNDTVDKVKTLLEPLVGLPPDQQDLLFAGKRLDGRHRLCDYNVQKESQINLVTRPRAAESLLPTETVFPDRDNVIARIQAWETKGEKGRFKANLCVIDPVAYYARLSYLESDVIVASEFYRSKGRYGDVVDDELQAHLLAFRDKHMSVIPDWMRAILDDDPSTILPDSLIGHMRLFQETLASLWTSYLILCRVLTSFDTLIKAQFCMSYYSILLQQADKSIAEIVRIPRVLLENIKTGIEAFTVEIRTGEIDPELIHTYLRERVESPCSQLLEVLHLSTSDAPKTTSSILALCRTTTLMADLGLVSYVGSHATRFDREYLHTGNSTIILDRHEAYSMRFECRLRSLACLDGFLDRDKVWVFRCSNAKSTGVIDRGDLDTTLSILTHIEEFADIWGPVWSIQANQESSRFIKQHNVSKGVICRVDENETQKGKPVKCHWYDWDSFQKRRSNPLLSSLKPLHLRMDDLLLIGTRFRENTSCKYTLDQYERAYGLEMGILGTEAARWEPGLDSRSASIGFSKIIGVTVSGSQKMHPMTTHKQQILAEWTTEPQDANPGILNQCLAVEISHCTGNARRVRLKDLFLMPTIRQLLDLRSPKWSETVWGSAFLEALQSNDPEAVFAVWMRHHAYRNEIAALVCRVLKTLNKTGKTEQGLVAAFLNNRQQSSIILDKKSNDWSSLLQDSHLMATYAVINKICIECHTPDHSTATCDGDPAHTVLETRLGLDQTQDAEFVKVKPHGPYFKILKTLDPKSIVLQPSSFEALLSLRSLPARPCALAAEIRDLAALSGKQYIAYVRSSNKSHSGMKQPRSRPRMALPPSPQQTGRLGLPNATSSIGEPSLPAEESPRPRSASNIPTTELKQVFTCSSTRLRVSDSQSHSQLEVPTNRQRGPGSVREAGRPASLNEGTLTSMVLPQVLPPAPIDAPGERRLLAQDDHSGTQRNYGTSQAPSRQIPFGPPPDQATSYQPTRNTNTINTRAQVPAARNETSALPKHSADTDIQHHQTDVLANHAAPQSLLDDLKNFQLDDDDELGLEVEVEVETSPPTPRPSAGSRPRPPSANSSPAPGIRRSTDGHRHRLRTFANPTMTDGHSKRAMQSPAPVVEPPGRIARFLGRLGLR